MEVTNDYRGSASEGQIRIITNEKQCNGSEDAGGTTAFKEEAINPRHDLILNYDALYALRSPRQKLYTHKKPNFLHLKKFAKRLVALWIPICHQECNIQCVIRYDCKILDEARTCRLSCLDEPISDLGTTTKKTFFFVCVELSVRGWSVRMSSYSICAPRIGVLLFLVYFVSVFASLFID
jgi:hypothetical protein